MDASAVYNDMRGQLLATEPMEAEKYLIILRVDWDEILRREGERSGDPSYLRKLAADWEEPADLECTVLEYRNDTPEDLEAIRADLHNRFKKRE